jgi:hypothetical protein
MLFRISSVMSSPVSSSSAKREDFTSIEIENGAANASEIVS